MKEEDFIEIGFEKEFCEDGAYYYSYEFSKQFLVTSCSDEGDWKVYFSDHDIQILTKEDVVNLIDILTKQMKP